MALKSTFYHFSNLRMGINLTYAECFTLLKKFDTNGDLRLGVRELFDALKQFVNTGSI